MLGYNFLLNCSQYINSDMVPNSGFSFAMPFFYSAAITVGLLIALSLNDVTGGTGGNHEEELAAVNAFAQGDRLHFDAEGYYMIVICLRLW